MASFFGFIPGKRTIRRPNAARRGWKSEGATKTGGLSLKNGGVIQLYTNYGTPRIPFDLGYPGVSLLLTTALVFISFLLFYFLLNMANLKSQVDEEVA